MTPGIFAFWGLDENGRQPLTVMAGCAHGHDLTENLAKVGLALKANFTEIIGPRRTGPLNQSAKDLADLGLKVADQGRVASRPQALCPALDQATVKLWHPRGGCAGAGTEGKDVQEG